MLLLNTMMRVFIFFFLVLAGFTETFGQATGRVRLQPIDVTEFNQQLSVMAYSKDKIKATENFLQLTDQLFTQKDEEYFTGHKMAALYYETAGNLIKATEHTQIALQAYDKNFPFYTNGYANVTPDSYLLACLDLSRLQRTLNLFEKNIKYLESKQAVLENSESVSVRQQFYSEYGQTLLGVDQFPKAIEAGLKLKELTESGALKTNFQSADELYKIDPTWPKETQEAMQKAKENYSKSIVIGQEAMISSQRMAYNTILWQAYFNQYQFSDAVPYAKGNIDELSKSRQLSLESFRQANYQIENLHDSIKQQISESVNYMNLLASTGGFSIPLIISAYKSNQPTLANQYATGKFDHAVLMQLSKNYEQSERDYQSAFNILKQIANYKFVGRSSELYQKAFLPYYLKLLVQASRLEAAYKESITLINSEESLLRESFSFFTENEKKEFFKAYTQKLDQHYSLLLQMTEKGDNHTGEILNKVLQAKGVILDATREQESQLRKIKDKVALAQIAEIKRLRDKLSSYYQLSLKAPTPALADSISKTSIRISDLEGAVNLKLDKTTLLKPVRWQEVQAKLKKGQVYLEILRLQRDSFSFDKPKIQYWGLSIKPGDTQPSLFLINESEAFEGRGLRNYQNRIRGELEDVDSYKLYWSTIEESTRGANTIFLSADGVYHVINPLTLKNEQSGKYLLDEISLRRVSTGRDLLNAEPAQAVQTLALVGNPLFDMNRKGGSNSYRRNESKPVESGEFTRSGIARLPGTQKEIDLIETMAEASNLKINVLTDAEANESKVKDLSSPGILHLATHGEFDQLSKVDTYLKSKLILAGAADSEPFLADDYEKYEDGFLTAYEVTQLDLLNTRLVVLSACETGLGEIQSGEGVWGLQRAFQLAGVKTVMGSLWKISDEATVTFMETFYKKYLTNSDIYAAYQEAMSTTKQKYPHPYFWGAFTLVGSN
jgi:CHAT domain-containing protein